MPRAKILNIYSDHIYFMKALERVLVKSLHVANAREGNEQYITCR